MRISCVYMGDDGWEKIKIVQEDQVVEYLVKNEKLDEIIAEGKFTYIGAYLNDFHPVNVTNMVVARYRDSFNLRKVRVMDQEYPEQKWRFDKQQGRTIEVATEEEKKIQAELGGKDKPNGHKNTELSEKSK